MHEESISKKEREILVSL